MDVAEEEWKDRCTETWRVFEGAWGTLGVSRTWLQTGEQCCQQYPGHTSVLSAAGLPLLPLLGWEVLHVFAWLGSKWGGKK